MPCVYHSTCLTTVNVCRDARVGKGQEGGEGTQTRMAFRLSSTSLSSTGGQARTLVLREERRDERSGEERPHSFLSSVFAADVSLVSDNAILLCEKNGGCR